MVCVRPVASREALGEMTYPNASAAASTLARVAGETRGSPRNARETVAGDTPARSATSSRLLLIVYSRVNPVADRRSHFAKHASVRAVTSANACTGRSAE